MGWYKTGTVSVTQGSNAVIGTGTSFIANARVGDAFRGPDGEWYEVTNIASDTALSIAPGYLGPAAGAGVYSLAPMQGYVKESADALRAATQVIAGSVAGVEDQVAAATEAAQSAGQSKVAATEQAGVATNAANTSAASKDAAAESAMQSQSSAQAAGSAATRAEAARDSVTGSEAAAAESARAAKASADHAEEVTLGKATSGSNSDITSLSGLTTALSITQGGTGAKTKAGAQAALDVPTADAPLPIERGGTGAKTKADARTALGLGSAAVAPIVGAVSQVGGVPSGAILEYGSNANGDYTKYADGRMICSRKLNLALAPNTAWGSAFITALQSSQQFAATFIVVPAIGILLTMSNGYSGTGWIIGAGEPTTTSWPVYYLADLASRGATSFNIHFTATGRWF